MVNLCQSALLEPIHGYLGTCSSSTVFWAFKFDFSFWLQLSTVQHSAFNIIPGYTAIVILFTEKQNTTQNSNSLLHIHYPTTKNACILFCSKIMTVKAYYILRSRRMTGALLWHVCIFPKLFPKQFSVLRIYEIG